VGVHEVAAAGFDDPQDYEAARPSYPAEAVAWLREHLRVTAATRVCDLAAGTGKLTRLLVPFTPRLVAVEPVAGMRATFRTLLPELPLLAATAEALPFATGALDAVTVAQAFHWFDFDAAVAELARALRPGARLALVWNARDRNVDWVDQVWSIMDRVEKHAPWRDHENWRDSAQRAMPGFGALHEAHFRHEQLLTPEDVVRRVASVSHVAVLPPNERESVLDEVRRVVANHPQTRGLATVAIPYRVDCYWAERNLSGSSSVSGGSAAVQNHPGGGTAVRRSIEPGG
jgi:SAM-dependent methyltransferase